MKGFTITPILFVGLFLIIGLMLITFSDIDRKAAVSAEKESVLGKAQADMLQKQISDQNILHINSILAAVGSKNDADLKNNITILVGDTAYLTDCQQAYFTVVYNKTYTKNYPQASINTTYTLSQNITCADIQGLKIFGISIQCPAAVFSC